MPNVPIVVLLFACLLAGPTWAEGPDGISPLLSRCAGKAGSDMRQGDPAFVTIALDGRPWMTIERTDATVGTQPISTMVTGTGWRQRRDGTSVSFRFTCLLDEQGQAMMFHATSLLHDLGDRLPPAIVVDGAAAHPEKATLPRGVELQVQLLDPSQPPATRVLAEQVVRSGWLVPIAFALRLPKETTLASRPLAISARVVLARQTLFELENPRTLTADDLHKFVALTLVKARMGDR